MTTHPDLEQLRFPVGQLVFTKNTDTALRKQWLDTIHDFPALLRSEVEPLSANELAYRYRPNGWSIQQLVHHCADSHMNAFIRFKLALTEATPTIKPYAEAIWAKGGDYSFPIATSLQILTGLHARWTHVLANLSETDLQRTYLHPEGNMVYTLQMAFDTYQWHCRHHLAHVQQAKLYQFTE